MSILAAFILPHPPLIIPEVGKGDQLEIQKTIDSYIKIAKEIGEISPDTIIISTPHSIMYADYIHISPGEKAEGNFWSFGASDVSYGVDYDQEFSRALELEAKSQNLQAGTQGEKDKSLDHGTMVPLHFIEKYAKDYKIVRIGISGLDDISHYKMGKIIKKVSDKLGKKTVFIASGDLSHKLKEDGPYGLAKEGPEFDREIIESMKKANFKEFLEISPSKKEAAAECGLKGFITMAGALDKTAVETEFLSYENPFGVGYAVCAYKTIGQDETRNFDEKYLKETRKKIKEKKEKESPYVGLARKAIENYVKYGEEKSVSKHIPKEMTDQKAGVFVTIYKHGNLRGCIGTISPVTENIAFEINRNAIEAAIMDPRFSPINIDELDDLTISVDILSQAEAIEGAGELDVKNYGVIVSSGRKRGLLLPNLEGIDDVEEQISIAKQKAGIYDNEKFTMERFKVVRYT